MTEESSQAVPGSDGTLRLRLGEITRGQVRMAVINTNEDREVTSTSASQGDELSFHLDDRRWKISVKKLFNFLVEDDYGVFVASRRPAHRSEGYPHAEKKVVSIASFPDDLDVQKGEPFKRWMKKLAWVSEFGSPEYFYLHDGGLHMVSKPGAVYNNRYTLALTNREKLIEGMENKVLLRLKGGADFRVDAEKFPYITFKMSPLKLPRKDADLQDPDRNDSAFYLMVGFDTKRHEFEGRKMPETVAYVWANRKWDEPVGSDPDYAEFLRYIPIGHGREGLGESHVIKRDVRRDYRRAFSLEDGAPVPDIIKVGIMIDSNTVGGIAESVLHWIRLRREL